MISINFYTKSISSGEFEVSERSEKFLKAFLGTCVGVIMIDTQKQVGGLYHILLAEPPDKDNPWEATRYASSGMPLFLSALYDQGAKKENLEAVVAGGALVGPVSMQDLDLDIGGRTVEKVMSFLRDEGISVIQTETGGYFSCSLSLNMQNWDWKIEPIGMSVQGEIHTPNKLTFNEVDDAIGRVRPIPQIVLKVIRMLHSDAVPMRELSEEIRQDQVMSAKVIKLINSAFVSLSREVSSIDQALLVLGEHKLLLLALSVFSELLFRDYEQGYSLCKGGMYHHAIGTAVVSEKIASLTGAAPPDLAYTAGLMHDIGKLVLDQYIARDHPYFYRQLLGDHKSLNDIEEQTFGISHTQTGARLAKLWSLPDDLQEVIAFHHIPEGASLNPALTHIVFLADLLMSGFRVGYEIERMDSSHLAPRLKVLNLKPEHLPAIIDYIPWNTFDSSVIAG